MAGSFGSLGGLGGFAPPTRTASPNSQHIKTLSELQAPIQNEYQGLMDVWQQDMGGYDDALRQSFAADIAGAGLNPNQNLSLMLAMSRVGKNAANAGNADWLSGTMGQSGADAYTATAQGMPDFAPFQARMDAIARPFNENQTRQQQAYDWMQGGNQQNALMSPDYAKAGFNTITGTSNPNAGPGQIEGVDMGWAQGVYDPATQQGTGTYQPTWQRNTGFGW